MGVPTDRLRSRFYGKNYFFPRTPQTLVNYMKYFHPDNAADITPNL